MGQQPNIEITEKERPRPTPKPGPSASWRATKPGIPDGPEDVPSFGRTGPDPGWALKLVARAELPDDDPKLASVVTGLVMARAAALGRAAVPEDIEAALVVCGYADDVTADLVERRKRWLAAVPHENRPGETAVAEVDPELLIQKPDAIRYVYRHSARTH
ncbi:MAG: hypothetical protein R3258_09955 [Acidimicrobiia bacterium]|nr:hypothetical protein [Acidimicrobiia bacterium]